MIKLDSFLHISKKYIIIKRYLHSIIKEYIDIRSSDTRYTFNDDQIKLIDKSFYDYPISYNKNASIINPSDYPISDFDNKYSDDFMILLWNIIFPDFTISKIEEIKPISITIIDYFDRKYPSGINMNEEELIRYITAHSSSSFIGIQKESKSLFSLNSMKKTLTSHSQFNVRSKPWLISNLLDCKSFISNYDIMNKNYGDVCLLAKSSRTSIVNDSRLFRDYVFENTINDILNNITDSNKFPPYIINAGKRNDRRGKFRLICSFHADVRILDFLFNNGSYDLCSHKGIYSQYTTEGLSGSDLWLELAKMSFRDSNCSMVCLDFKGYDSQISLQEYIDISCLLNSYRFYNDSNHELNDSFNWFINWLKQPKFLISEGFNESKDILIPYYRTLASGLHGTHSFENLIGISYAKEVEKNGIPVRMFKANGDDQNIMTDKSKVYDLMDFTSKYFDVEYSKSLIDHQLTVWGKKWFTRAVYPVIEIGTIRSLWEKEGGSSSYVEPSKIENNYCKIINLIIFLYRLKIKEDIIKDLMVFLCSEVGILHDRLPISLQTLKQIQSDDLHISESPKGLESCKQYLSAKTVDTKIIGSRDVYNLLLGMYNHRIFYDLDIGEIEYHPDNTELIIESNFNYSVGRDENIPWMLIGIENNNLTQEQNFIKSILQGTNSYDGSVNISYKFTNMYELALSIHNRNLEVWKDIQSKI